MGVRRPFEEKPDYGVKPQMVDFLRSRLDKSGLSLRALKAATPDLTKSRLGEILHTDPCRRRPMRLNEYVIIRTILGISEWEATFACELIQESMEGQSEETTNLAPLMAAIMDGLAPRIANVLIGISGLEASDIRPEHGAAIRDLLLENFERGYIAVVARKGFRLTSAID